MAEKPTLIFSFARYRLDPSVRGARLISMPISKLEEMDLITAAGCAVPEARLITKDTQFNETDWGPFTVVKPNRGTRVRGVRLLRTRDVRCTDTTILPKEDPLHGQQFVAQRFVDTGPFVTCYRVMMLLGRPIYCVTSTAVEKRPDLDADGAGELDVPVAANGMQRKMALSSDREVIDLATSLHAALPLLPVMGVDVIREHGTGRLFALEFNSHGFVWHLSSQLGVTQQRDNGIDFYNQFNALI